jgi:tRNA(Ile)-lysidine synthase
LLLALLRVQRFLGFYLEVCHVNHGLRPGSADDAEFVRSFCDDVGLPCNIVALDPRPQGVNIEAWARQMRYAAFSRVMDERALEVLLTAHNANDVAETFLMRMIANKELNSIEEDDSRRRVVRPLIEVTRAQIDCYVREYGVRYVEDPTNIDTDFVRNRIRHELLPMLAQSFDPSIVWNLADRARSVASDLAALREISQSICEIIGPVETESLLWLQRCRDQLLQVPASIQWRIVQSLFTPKLGYSIGEAKSVAIVEILIRKSGGLSLNKELFLECRTGGLALYQKADGG